MEYRLLGEEEFRDLESRILYEDNHILVFNKRPGEIVRARCMWGFRIALTGLSVV